MALVRDLSKSQIAFQVGDKDVDLFQVIRYRGTEGLSQLYRFEIEVATSEPEVAFGDFIGKPAVLSISAPGGDRYFHGVVSRLELTGEAGGTPYQLYFRVELVPAVWLLTHRYQSRIFQQKTVKEIIATVLERGGIPSDRLDMSGVTRTYESREYCVQYRETDFNFICRLMEEEGIYYFFRQSVDGHVMVMVDGAAQYTPIEGDPQLPYKPPSGMNAPGEHVFRFRLGQSVRPGAVVLNDFDFKNPALPLEAKSDAGRDTHLEFSDCPGDYIAQGTGQELAQIRAQEFECGRTVGIGQSNCPRLNPGRTFTLIEHPVTALNSTYTLTTMTHQGKQATLRASGGQNGRAHWLGGDIRQALQQAKQHADPVVRSMAEGLLELSGRIGPSDETANRAMTNWLYHAGQVTSDAAVIALASGGHPFSGLSIPNLVNDIVQGMELDRDAPIYECRFECLPSTIAFRPPRITPRPIVGGSQTARVVGPEGEEIHTDEFGRVRVQFHWDRDGCEAGEPKRFGADSSCWIRVSQGAAGGQYGMMFLPRIGQEVIVDFLEGDPDQPIVTGRVYNSDLKPPYPLPDEKTKSVIKTHSSKGGGGTNEIRFEDLKDNEQILIYAQKNLHVRANTDYVATIGHEHHLTVTEDKHELVKKNKTAAVELDYCQKVGGTLFLKVGGDVGQKYDGNHSEETGGNYLLKTGGAIVIEAGSEITLAAGGNFVKIDSSGVTVMGTQIKLNSGGSAGSGSAVSEKEVKEPLLADSAEPGKDVTYSGESGSVDGIVPADGRGHEPTQEEPKKPTSWIEIQLVDELGGPVRGEQYLIKTPDGKELRGALNQEGLAHVTLVEPGSCMVSFPNLDAETWIRDAGAPAPPSGGNVGKSPPPENTSDSSSGGASGSGGNDGESAEAQSEESATVRPPGAEPSGSAQSSAPASGSAPSAGTGAAQSSAPGSPPRPPRRNPYRK